uniref:Uncharacterized protein n=1 Tax=Arundo donax TaxID=35708 RepID=A0A0A9THX9_ARUDO
MLPKIRSSFIFDPSTHN